MPVLEQDEAANSLMIGIILGSLKSTDGYEDKYFAYIENAGNIIAVIVMTPPFGPVLYIDEKDSTECLNIFATDLIKNNYAINDALGKNRVVKEFAAIYAEMTNSKASLFMNMRIYKLIKVNNIEFSSGFFRQANMDDIHIIPHWIKQFREDVGEINGEENFEEIAEKRIKDKTVYVWEDEKIVSMAVKIRPTRNYIAVGGVLTPKELRRKGYATSLVAALSKQLLEDGYKACVLFTDLSNPTSNSIYQKIGYEYVCDFDKYRFSQRD